MMLLGKQSSTIWQVMVLQVGSEMFSWQSSQHSSASKRRPLQKPLTDFSPYLMLCTCKKQISVTHGNTQNSTNSASEGKKGNLSFDSAQTFSTFWSTALASLHEFMSQKELGCVSAGVFQFLFLTPTHKNY